MGIKSTQTVRRTDAINKINSIDINSLTNRQIENVLEAILDIYQNEDYAFDNFDVVDDDGEPHPFFGFYRFWR